MMNKITIDGIEYEADQLSDNAKNQLGSMQACDQKIRQLQVDLAIAQTARSAYAMALKGELPESGVTVTNGSTTEQ
jgi:hypothetical protein